MKYMLMIYGNEELWGSFPQEELAQVVAETNALQAELKASGEFVGAYGVGDQVLAKTVTHRRRRARGHRRPVPRGQGVPGQLRHRRRRQPGAGARDRGPGAVRPLRPGRGATADARGRRTTREPPPPATEDLLRDARAAGPRRAGAPLRPLRRRRGRGAGGAARRRGAVAGRRDDPTTRRRGCHRGDAPADRPAARRRRRAGDARTTSPRAVGRADAPTSIVPADDDTLTLLFLCCHPVLSPPSQLALTLRAVGGLTTAEIARAFLVPEATMAQRISRAKQSIKASGATVPAPAASTNAPTGSASCCTSSTSIFNEGYTTSSGDDLQRADLTAEAIRLTRLLHEAAARRRRGRRPPRADAPHRRPPGPAQPTPTARSCPLDEQDRSQWDHALIDGGRRADHARRSGRSRSAPTSSRRRSRRCTTRRRAAEDTDWRADPRPLRAARPASHPTRWRRSTARSRSRRCTGRRRGSTCSPPSTTTTRVADHHRLLAVRAHLLERAGDLDAARAAYREAARRTTSRPEQRHLEARAARLS